MSPENFTPRATSVLLIDGDSTDRALYADGLKRCSSDYRVLEANDGQSGFDLYRQPQRIDCVVLELALPDRSGFGLLLDLRPILSRPTAVIVLTRIGHRGWWGLAMQIGAQACLFKPHTSAEDLDKAIRHAVAHVGQLLSEDHPGHIC